MDGGEAMKISIITDVLNAKDTVESTIESVLAQTYQNIEYIIVDGVSTDGTLEIIKKYNNRIFKFISEPDVNHFDAMNKGISAATGDVIGFLHADDFFTNNNVLEKVMGAFEKETVDSVWGDIVYVGKSNTKKIIRYWKSSPYRENLFKKGWMPPHPAFFVKKWVYDKYGDFNIDLEIASDYELMLRFLHKNNISNYYISEVLVGMRVGGLSNGSIKNIIQKCSEDFKSWKLNNLKGVARAIFLKNISKIPQFFQFFYELKKNNNT